MGLIPAYRFVLLLDNFENMSENMPCQSSLIDISWGGGGGKEMCSEFLISNGDWSL